MLSFYIFVFIIDTLYNDNDDDDDVHWTDRYTASNNNKTREGGQTGTGPFQPASSPIKLRKIWQIIA